MSQRAPGAYPLGSSRPGCDWCIYGAVRWYVEYHYLDALWDQEAYICDRCLAALYAKQEHGLVDVFACEEA